MPLSVCRNRGRQLLGSAFALPISFQTAQLSATAAKRVALACDTCKTDIRRDARSFGTACRGLSGLGSAAGRETSAFLYHFAEYARMQMPANGAGGADDFNGAM
jgi:hypothetical protein